MSEARLGKLLRPQRVHIRKGRSGRPGLFPTVNLLAPEQTTKLGEEAWAPHYVAAYKKLATEYTAYVDPAVRELIAKVLSETGPVDPSVVDHIARHPGLAGNFLASYGAKYNRPDLAELGSRMLYDPTATNRSLGHGAYTPEERAEVGRRNAYAGLDVGGELLANLPGVPGPLGALLRLGPAVVPTADVARRYFFEDPVQTQSMPGSQHLVRAATAESDYAEAQRFAQMYPDLPAAKSLLDQAEANLRAVRSQPPTGNEVAADVRARQRGETVAQGLETTGDMLSLAGTKWLPAVNTGIRQLRGPAWERYDAARTRELPLAADTQGALAVPVQLPDTQEVIPQGTALTPELVAKLRAAGIERAPVLQSDPMGYAAVTADNVGTTALEIQAGDALRRLGSKARAALSSRAADTAVDVATDVAAKPGIWSRIWSRGARRVAGRLFSRLAPVLGILSGAEDLREGMSLSGQRRIREARDKQWADEADAGTSWLRDLASIPEAVFYDPSYLQGRVSGLLSSAEEKQQFMEQYRATRERDRLAAEIHGQLVKALPDFDPTHLSVMAHEAARRQTEVANKQMPYQQDMTETQYDLMREVAELPKPEQERALHLMRLVGEEAFLPAFYAEETGRNPAAWEALRKGVSAEVPRLPTTWRDTVNEAAKQEAAQAAEKLRQAQIAKSRELAAQTARESAAAVAGHREAMAQQEQQRQGWYQRLRQAELGREAMERRSMELTYAYRPNPYATRQLARSVGNTSKPPPTPVDHAAPVADNAVAASSFDFSKGLQELRNQGVIRGS